MTSVLRRCAAVLTILALAACNAPQPEPAEGFRDTKALMGATARFDAAKFAGTWQMRAAFPKDADFTSLALVELNTGSPAFSMGRRVCKASGNCTNVAETWRARELGQGRYALDNPNGGPGRALWVLWVDEGFRTAVIGAPSGRYGWILDRSKSGGADRIAAGREILDFNGYDVSKLEVVQ